MEATAACQLPQPTGANSQAIAPPSLARTLESIWSSSNIPKEPSAHPKNERNQTTIVESKIIVPAFLMNDQPRSHIERRTFKSVGQWYAGSSITNGAASPIKGFVFFKMIPEQMIAASPIK